MNVGFRYRRVRTKPILTPFHKLLRFLWCLENEHNDFENTVFADETCLRLKELPRYHWRPIGSYPEAVEVPTNSHTKINVWGGITSQGPTEFAVSVYIFLLFCSQVYIC